MSLYWYDFDCLSSTRGGYQNGFCDSGFFSAQAGLEYKQAKYYGKRPAGCFQGNKMKVRYNKQLTQLEGLLDCSSKYNCVCLGGSLVDTGTSATSCVSVTYAPSYSPGPTRKPTGPPHGPTLRPTTSVPSLNPTVTQAPTTPAPRARRKLYMGRV